MLAGILAGVLDMSLQNKEVENVILKVNNKDTGTTAMKIVLLSFIALEPTLAHGVFLD